ncbi:MAG: hypothetical protein V1709_03750, partial [Planctomycetota bacterium]
MPNKKLQFTESSIQNLIREFKQGNNKAFADLWEKVKPYVYRSIKQGVDEFTTEDLTSEVCAKLFDGRLRQYHQKKNISFISWLDKFVRNLKINELKRKRPANFSDLPGDKD